MKSSFKVLSFVVFAASLVVACGGSDRKPASGGKGDAGRTSGAVNGAKGGKSGGLLGGIKDSSGKGGDACKAASDDDACTSCLRGSCCAEVQACNGECPALFDCTEACGENDDGSCADACMEKHPEGALAVQALLACAMTSCATNCKAEEEPAAETCIGEPKKDAQYCPDASKPVLRDCPDGSPAEACSLSPTGAANVYCCPEG